MSNEKKSHIKLSDIISIIALILSIFSTFTSYNTNERAEKIDNATAVIAIQSIGGRLKELESNARMSYFLLTNLNNEIKKNPNSSDEEKKSRIDFIRKNNIKDLFIPQESILLIAKIDSAAAKKLAKCSTMLSSIESDMNNLSNTTDKSKLIILNVMPFRFYNLSEACSEANKSIEKYLDGDNIPKGTLGELMAAQELEYLKRSKKPQPPTNN